MHCNQYCIRARLLYAARNFIWKEHMAAVFNALYLALGVYAMCVIAWMILTTLAAFNMVNRQNRAVMLATYYLNRICGPATRRLRPRLPDTGQIDLAPLALLLLIGFAQSVLAVLATGHNPLIAVVLFAAQLLELIVYALIAQMVISLLINFNIVNRYQPFVAALDYFFSRVCDPLLAPVRRMLPPAGVIDFSGLLFIIVLGLLKDALVQLAYKL